MSDVLLNEEITRAEFDNALSGLTQDLDSSSKTTAAKRRPYVNTICQYADQHGLDVQDLRNLLDLAILPSKLDQTSRSLIIKSLYPACQVPRDVVYNVTGSLRDGVSKPAASVQVALLRWLIMVFPAFEDPTVLSSLYSVFFNMLGRMDIRAPLCHLIAMMTKRKHVKPFRLAILQQLSLDIPREPVLEKLVHMYEHLGSKASDSAGTKGLSIVFPHPDLGWGEQLQLIQQRARAAAASPGSYTQSFTFSSLRKGLKNDLSSSARRSEKRSHDAFEMTSVEDIVQHLEALEVPVLRNQDLGDRLLHHYLLLQSNEDLESQLNDFLPPFFDKQLDSIAKGDDIKKGTLETILTHTRLMTTMSNQTMTFLQTYLTKWDGQKHQALILRLLSYLPIQPLADLQKTHLDALETALLSNSPAEALSLLNFYTTLLHQWTTILSTKPAPISLSHRSSIHDLTAHTTLLLTTILTSPPTPQTTTPTTTPFPSILQYFNALLPLVLPPLSIPLPPPSSLLLYTLLFTCPTLPTLHTVSSLLATFKTAFEPPPPSPITPQPPTSTSTWTSPPSALPPPMRPSPQDIHTLNATLIDTCNLIFRTRAFNTTDAHSRGCLLPPATRSSLETYVGNLSLGPGLALAGLFGLSCHSALVGVSMEALREVEEAAATAVTIGAIPGEGGSTERKRHAGPVTQRSLSLLAREGGVKVSWKEYRVLVLRWLESVGVSGVGDLGRATMRGLGMGGGVGTMTGGGGGRDSLDAVTPAAGAGAGAAAL